MQNLIISKYEKLFDLMSLELKIELLSKLTDSIKNEVKSETKPNKQELLNELFGAWADMDDDITEIIYSSRTTSERAINFDQKMAKFLLDTDVCIAFLKGKNNLIEKVNKIGIENCYVSEITIGELTYGAYYSNQFEKHKKDVLKI